MGFPPITPRDWGIMKQCCRREEGWKTTEHTGLATARKKTTPTRSRTVQFRQECVAHHPQPQAGHGLQRPAPILKKRNKDVPKSSQYKSTPQFIQGTLWRGDGSGERLQTPV